MPCLRHAFANRRIDELGLRRWWIAEQLGVSQRTLRRWLTGRTYNIESHKLDMFASLLDVTPDALIVVEKTPLASEGDQVEAARALIQSNLLVDMMPPHQWELYERLAKGLVVEYLPKLELGQLYIAIGLSLFRQSKLGETWQYAERAQRVARECDDMELLLRASMLLSYRECVAGNQESAIRMDEQNLALASELGNPAHIAANLSNLADQYLEAGRLDDSIDFQSQAIAIYRDENAETSLTFCHLGLVAAFLAAGDLEAAVGHLETARASTEKINFLRGYADCEQFEAMIESARGNHGAAVELIERAIPRYETLGIEESRSFITAAKVHRAADNPESAKRYLERASQVARRSSCHVYLKQIDAEMATMSPSVR